MNYKLSKREREILRLRNVEGKTFSELAKKYNTTADKVRTIYEKAMYKSSKANPEHSCDDCYYYWGFVPTCHNSPHGSRACDRWEPKVEAREVDSYEAYQEEWN